MLTKGSVSSSEALVMLDVLLLSCVKLRKTILFCRYRIKLSEDSNSNKIQVKDTLLSLDKGITTRRGICMAILYFWILIGYQDISRCKYVSWATKIVIFLHNKWKIIQFEYQTEIVQKISILDIFCNEVTIYWRQWMFRALIKPGRGFSTGL